MSMNSQQMVTLARLVGWAAVVLVVAAAVAWLLGGCTTTHYADGSSTTSLLGLTMTETDPDGRSKPVWLEALPFILGAPPLASLLGRRGWQNASRMLGGLGGAVKGAVRLDGQMAAAGVRAAARGGAAMYGAAHTSPPAQPAAEAT